ncbi:serine/threonine-protein kinase [Striga asiatica]|uniref:Receptor-like serine/threonine-protein kinase n=1 Tax=Striga asiatica TaxID=4170 RepID=A0A5A7QK13_STRAF|nr:serine/threonine-protein kinase [Striga asiatica]
MPTALALKLILILLFSLLVITKSASPFGNYADFSKKTPNSTEPRSEGSKKVEPFENSQVLLRGNTSITSPNGTFKLGFFALNDEYSWYLGIWYACIPIPTYIWVANREKAVKSLSSASAEITETGRFTVTDQESKTLLWETSNVEKAKGLSLLEEGNLVLLSADGRIVWQSFDFPSDTSLPGMNLTAGTMLNSWRSSIDPSPGRYFLRLNPPDYGEIALYYSNASVGMDNNLYTYWTTGNWSGSAFAGVPEMTIPYIYKFNFVEPFTPMATFMYMEVPLEVDTKPPLTRFVLDHTGRLKQFTWSQQSGGWNIFWAQPENVCKVYGLCGNLGMCNGNNQLSPCQCLNGFSPSDGISWLKGDFSKGCWRTSRESCSEHDKFEEIGTVSHERTAVVSFSGRRAECESACLKNCSCIGLYHNEKSNSCRNLYGPLLNLLNVTSDSSTISTDTLYLRVQPDDGARKTSNNAKMILSVGIICSVLAILCIGITNLYVRRQRRRRSARLTRGEDNDNAIQVSNLRVFSYKELHSATKGFSEKLGHGGFGAVFKGQLADSSAVAVKRLERPGGGEKEFRAEVCTIGRIQHVNLVRLRGFCSEASHRLLVYDFMPNGALSTYLRRGNSNKNGQPVYPNLSWEARFRIAIGTARGIAYLHEECRSCIIHCDIKPENILLDEGFAARVSDFGLAKLVGRDLSRVVATMRGTWGYVAPEWISGVAITTKADVYSFGMTLLELIGGRRNVPPPAGGENNNNNNNVAAEEGGRWFYPPWAARRIVEGDVVNVVDERLSAGEYDVAEAARMGFTAVWCIQDEEGERPAMGTVVKMLEGVVEVVVPPLPKLLQALVSGESFRGVVVGRSGGSHGAADVLV